MPPGQPALLHLRVEREPPWVIVHLAGELDWESHASFDACLSALTGQDGQRPWVCLDLSGLEFCDSTGIARMLRAAREIGRRGGRMLLRSPEANLARRLAAMGVAALIPIVAELPG